MRLFTFVARLNLGSQQEPSPPAAMNVNELAAPRFLSVGKPERQENSKAEKFLTWFEKFDV